MPCKLADTSGRVVLKVKKSGGGGFKVGIQSGKARE